MTNNQTQIDEYGFDYQLLILHKMIDKLPKDCVKLINDQLDAVLKSITTRNKFVKNTIIKELEDIRLNVLMLEFDNSASKQERDKLQQKLNELT